MSLIVTGDLAIQAVNAPMQALCRKLVYSPEDRPLQEEEDLFGKLVRLGAAVWRHIAEFIADGPDTVQ